MSMRIDGANYTDQQIEMLRMLGKRTVGMDKTSGFEDRTLTILAGKGLCEIDDERATITDKGRELLPKLNGERTAAAPATDETPIQATATKTSKVEAAALRRDSRERPAAKESPPPTDKVDIAALREAIDAQYAADIAALERVAEIQKAASA